ncbi:hypothetical protein [Paraflavitalea sp. CAU 1676]|uniref:hypothetical protein n=1 Tax=Paraflavitalea sp. CAU 1676 TaxID=3032598 RepID=UPI0023DAD6CE|nr:hypothetical protein [Paraflavitalea sp. CAU 1676]MDF2189015.1 hypothetical protein [Paraflavitalea sp. CAU 1676]
MNRTVILLVLFLWASFTAGAQARPIGFTSTDTALQTAFSNARQMALSYRGSAADPVGPWYEAALPSRRAFCIRDVSHQCLAAESLGMSGENKNMFLQFVSNISAKKDWCTYWEMNYLGKPAPEDYRNDTAFWYNLNANFDLIYACWRLYLWTGDTDYIRHPAFESFHLRSLNEFIDRWTLQADSLLARPAYPNAPVPFNIIDYFHRCRGLPSYTENVADLKMGVDLVAALYRGAEAWSAAEAWRGNKKAADLYARKAAAYRHQLESAWWDPQLERYYTHVTNNGVFGRGEGETFLLWFDALKDSARIRSTIGHLVNNDWNVENLSYQAYQLYRYGYWDKAYSYILYLTNPATKRRDYPEVSFGAIEGIVQGLMGVEADARFNRVSTLYRSRSADRSSLFHLPVLSSTVTVEHWQNGSSLLNEGKKAITWRVAFNGEIPFIEVAGRKMKATRECGIMGNFISYVDVRVPPGKKLVAGYKKS